MSLDTKWERYYLTEWGHPRWAGTKLNCPLSCLTHRADKVLLELHHILKLVSACLPLGSGSGSNARGKFTVIYRFSSRVPHVSLPVGWMGPPSCSLHTTDLCVWCFISHLFWADKTNDSTTTSLKLTLLSPVCLYIHICFLNSFRLFCHHLGQNWNN